ncbi:MAG: hypothetical protein J5998_03540 [Clostridia bacterium]|nr:hypothetical protein [Clostridia bacterium]
MTGKDVQKLLGRLQTLQRRKDEVLADIKEIHEAIKSYMHVRGLDEFDLAGWRVTWKQIEYKTLDVKAFTEALPDLADRFSVFVGQRRFKVARTPTNSHR